MTAAPESMKTDVGKRQALKLVEHAAARLAKATSEHRSAIRLASELGCSLREVADAGAVSHQTVKNIVEAAGAEGK